VDIKRYARCNDGRGSFNSLFFSDEPIDIARAVAFLCGPGGEMIRGQVIVVDGGFSLPI